ncbi:ABC transporter substrate-binding protein [Streptomyces sp. NPDC020681]|uniref:ABC transporter substrate-binding protein n=1 Tax=Streptomyces sp. NPDC020681 TaxID=3365083 RepID=UPI0037888FC8
MSRTSRTSTFALAASAAALALLATACGGSGNSSNDAGSDGKPITLTYWSWTLGAQNTVDEFNRTHKNIQVKFSEIPGQPDGYTKISNAVKAGNAPDIATIEYQMVPEFASQGSLVDISEYAADTVESKFPKGLQDLVTFGGKTWSVPFDATPQLLYYRSDLFKKYGIEVPKTWDEFKTTAEKVKKAEKNARIASFPKTDPALLAALSWQAGGKWFATEGDSWKPAVDDAGSKKVAAYWDGLIQDDLVQNFAGYSPEETKARLSGQTLAFLGASWSAGGMSTAMPDLKGKWAAAPIPHWGTPASGNYGGTSYAVMKGSKKAEAAVEFIKWVTTNGDAVKARLGSLKSPSSALPANPEMRAVAAKEFDTSYLGGQDLYKLGSEQVDTIQPGWTWGPVQLNVYQAIQDAAVKTTFTDGLAAGQQTARTAIKDRGLKLAE